MPPAKFSRGKGKRSLGNRTPSDGNLPVSSRRHSTITQEQSVHASARDVFDDHRLTW